MDFKFQLHVDESQMCVSTLHIYTQLQTHQSDCYLDICRHTTVDISRHQNEVVDAASPSFILLPLLVFCISGKDNIIHLITQSKNPGVGIILGSLPSHSAYSISLLKYISQTLPFLSISTLNTLVQATIVSCLNN